MAGSFGEITRKGVSLSDADMLMHVKNLYAIAMEHKDEWAPPMKHHEKNRIFSSPTFSYPQPHSIRRAQLVIHPEDGYGPIGIDINNPWRRSHRLPKWSTDSDPFLQFTPSLKSMYSMVLASAAGDEPFNIQRGSYSIASGFNYSSNPDPEVFVLESDPERQVVQRIIAAAIDKFAVVEVPMPSDIEAKIGLPHPIGSQSAL
jgi:hypothetical protein